MYQLKPPLTYKEQIEHLKKYHGLVVSDESYALEILKRVNYYRLSAYGIGLRKIDDKEKYIDGISIEHIYRLYEFDSTFRNILIHIIEQIEIQFRAQISNYLGIKYGSECYMDKSIFIDKQTKDGHSVYSSIIDNFNKELTRQTNVPFVKHHINKYGGHFPIWVAVELFTFGNLASLYSILSYEDRKEIANQYNTKEEYLEGWILSLVEIRNICAHYSRIYNMPLKQSPYLYSEYKKYRNNKIFPVLITIKRMLKSDERWSVFYKDLDLLMDEYKDVVKFNFMGFPIEWKSVLDDNI